MLHLDGYSSLVLITQFFAFLSFLTAVINIHLVLYGDLHVQQALALVASEEAYMEVLELEFKPRVEGDDQPPVPQAAVPNPILESAIQKAKERHIEGDAPPHFVINHHTARMPPAPYAWTTRNNTCTLLII